jgi:K+-sensing histidine kinase KdpD
MRLGRHGGKQRAVVMPAPELSTRRQLLGLLWAAAALPVLTAALVPHRSAETYAVPVLLMLLAVVVSALLGGLRAALPAAVAGVLLLNWFFTPPYGSFDVARGEQLVVLLVFLAVAVAVSAVMALAVRRTADAAMSRAEAAALSTLAGAALSRQETLPGLLERVRSLFGLSEVALLERTSDDWRVAEVVSTGTIAVDDVEQEVAAGPVLRLRLRGPELLGRDQRLLASFAQAAATAMEGRRLAERAAEAASLEAADRARVALLAAVGHDLRTPLAALRAAADSLGQHDVAWTADQTAELVRTVAESSSRMEGLVENLLDASRLQAGAVSAALQPTGLLEVVDRVLVNLDGGLAGDRLHVEVSESLPDMLADPGLTERVLMNLVENALRYSPAGTIVTVRAGVRDGEVHCDVVDHGPGIGRESWEQLFTPFQQRRRGSPAGLGLGLSVAHGLTQAMGGALVPSATDGGGLTMRLVLPVAPPA